MAQISIYTDHNNSQLEQTTDIFHYMLIGFLISIGRFLIV